MQPSISELFKEFEELADKRGELRIAVRELEKVEDRMAKISKLIKSYDYPKPTLKVKVASAPKEPPQSYSKNLTVLEKGLFVLRESGKFMTTRQITDRIKLLEGRTIDEVFNRTLLSNLSSVAGTNARDGIDLKRFRYGGDYVYGLLDWYNEDGTPKIEHMD